MAAFEVLIQRIDQVEAHPGADRLTLNRIGGYCAIANKTPDGAWRHQAGDLVAYVPEGALCPDWFLRRFGYWNAEKGAGMLAGSAGNRVKAIRLRGIFSQGLIVRLRAEPNNGLLEEAHRIFHLDGENSSIAVKEGDDVATFMGIVKYEPPVPVHMAGEMRALDGHTLKFDIENVKKHPAVLSDGEDVVFTEKVHGTFCQVGIAPGLAEADLFGGDAFVASKGFASKGIVFKNVPANTDNLYVSTVLGLGLIDKIRAVFAPELAQGWHVHVLGEIYGAGVQDLAYGLSNNRKAFAGFDIHVGKPGQGRFLDDHEKEVMFARLGIPRAPVLYRGAFSAAALAAHTDGKTEAGGGAHLREGVVVTPARERRDPALGRVILKSVSEAYLLRKGDTTEYA